MKIAVYITHTTVPIWNFSIDHFKKLQAGIPEAECVWCRSKEEFIAHLPGTEIALVWHVKDEWLLTADKLTWIMTPAAGRDYFHLDYHPQITIDYGTYHGEIIAETVIGMMLAEVRSIRAAVIFQQQGVQWPKNQISLLMRNLRGSRVTILGFGHIGQWIGKLLKPFGVQLTGVKQTGMNPPDFFTPGDKIVPVTELDAVLPTTDHLILALPSSDSTTDIINASRLDLLPANAVIYNIGRGNAIDEAALCAVLQTGKIQSAYLDVFKEEPLPENSPLRACKNLFIMPHACAIAPNYLDLFLDEFISKYHKRFYV